MADALMGPMLRSTHKMIQPEQPVSTSIALSPDLLRRLDQHAAATGQTRSALLAELIRERIPADQLAEVATELNAQLTHHARFGRNQVLLSELGVSEETMRTCLQQRRIDVPGHRLIWRGPVIHISVRFSS